MEIKKFMKKLCYQKTEEKGDKQMQLLYGTSNSAKLKHMQEMLDGLNIELIGLKDIDLKLKVDESGKDPLENARIKAVAYYRASGIPTFSCDSGLFIEGLSSERQPGVHVRRVNDKYLDDEEFITYYSNLAQKLGNPVAKFKNGICLVISEDEIYIHDGDDLADKFIMTSKIHPERREGFPMDSIAIDISTRKYFIEVGNNSKNEAEIREGFRKFFKDSLNLV